MSIRLNDGKDESGSLALVAEGKHAQFGEFRIGDKASIPVDIEGGLKKSKAQEGLHTQQSSKLNESSSLLKCIPPGQSR